MKSQANQGYEQNFIENFKPGETFIVPQMAYSNKIWQPYQGSFPNGGKLLSKNVVDAC